MECLVSKNSQKAHHFPVKLMGCGFVLTAVAHNKQLAWDAIRAGVREISRIEDLISSWKETSVTSEINRMAGIRPVKTPPELLGLILRSKRVSELSGGAFDISGTLSRDYWNFDQEAHEPLPEDQVEALRMRMGHQLIEVDEQAGTVFLHRKGMKIGFGGIGKGYAALRARIVMEQMGIRSGLINASGDLCCWGNPPDREGWEIYLPDPRDRSAPLLFLNLPFGSVVTSGNHEHFTVINGRRLSHIVDPRTGYPVEALQGVSVVCPNPELADALATAVSVMGVEDGLYLLNELKGVEGLLIDADHNCYYTNHLQKFVA